MIFSLVAISVSRIILVIGKHLENDKQATIIAILEPKTRLHTSTKFWDFLCLMV